MENTTKPTVAERSEEWPDADAERAQPGDVLGIEREGETTSLGETSEEEDARRNDALNDDERPT